MPKPQSLSVPVPVFISHSSHTPEAKTWVKEFVQALRSIDGEDHPTRISPRLDRSDIGGGDDWRAWIAHELVGSRAGLVLLTKEATDSVWVLQETSFMLTRSRAEARYVFLPVVFQDSSLLADLSTESPWSDVWRGIDPAQRHALAAITPSDAAHEVARALERHGLSGYLPPIELLADQIGAKLEVAGKLTLENMVGQFAESQYSTHIDLSARAGSSLANATILDRSLFRATSALDLLGKTFSDLERGRIVEELSPLVFPHETALPLLEQEKWAYAIVADSQEYVVNKLVELAYLARRPPQALPIQNLDASADGLVAEIREASASLHSAEDPKMKSARLDTWINRNIGFVVLHPEIADSELAKLHDIYPGITFLIIYGHDKKVPDSRPQLRPTCNSTEEQKIHDDYDDAVAKFEVNYGL